VTVIAVRDGVVATDSRITLDGSYGTCQKLWRIGSMLVGFAGESGGSLRLLRALQDGKPAEADELRGGWALGLCKKRGIVYFDQAIEPEIITSPFMAIGTGGALAMGAMYRKASAIEAVRAAIALNANCGGPVQWMRLPDLHKATRKKA
jgi:ATP-dependent protease HslVU (ClpYQ) peptidase subunit